MAKSYPGIVLTKKGIDLIAQSNAQQQQIIFTKVCVGSGDVPANTSFEDLTALISQKLELPITSGLNEGNGQFLIRATLSNSTVTTGFLPKEVGVFAKVGTTGTEYLYAYTNGANQVGFIPSKDTPIETIKYNIRTVIANASDATVVIKDETFITEAELDAAFTTDTTSIIDSVLNGSVFDKLGSRVKWVKSYVNNKLLTFTNFKASQISDFYDAVINAIKTRTFSSLGVRWSFGSSGYIVFGQLFGNFCIQWVPFITNGSPIPNTTVIYPLACDAFLISTSVLNAAFGQIGYNNVTNNSCLVSNANNDEDSRTGKAIVIGKVLA